jgi:hypothetical protein
MAFFSVLVNPALSRKIRRSYPIFAAPVANITASIETITHIAAPL